VKILRNLLLTAFLTLTLSSCSNAADKKEIKPTGTRKGAPQGMKTYYMGRFAIDVPAEFRLKVQSQKIRYAEVSDFRWNPGDREKERDLLWAQRIAEIKKLPTPVDKKAILIEEMNLPSMGKWAKGVLYYGDYLITRRMFWTILMDYGETGVWLTIAGTNKDMMVKNFTNILAHYEYGLEHAPRESFYLNYGKILLPYLEQEKSYARFEGPAGMVLPIEMEETHKVEEAGVMDRLAASLAVNFAPGVDVDKIRTVKRTVAGLAGQEIVTRLSDKNGKELFFAWDYQGKEDSGEHPEIKIGIECPDGNLDEKLKIWDRVLDSFRPASK